MIIIVCSEYNFPGGHGRHADRYSGLLNYMYSLLYNYVYSLHSMNSWKLTE